ncbi:MAG: ATP-NAD kinase [Cellvibrionaceae bacterium]|nr:ATP-NAD kinase [Cellvibrionaceae bacterium]|tara:strand:- start:34360 stop:35523 length:1164 start_codon:yes stop_codon:yes gene_type:complete
MNTNHLRLGLVVNPWAGIGGPAGLKGSDDRQLVVQAMVEGAAERVSSRVERCLERLQSLCGESVSLLTAANNMGESYVRRAGFTPSVVYSPESESTHAQDSVNAATAIMAAGVDLLLFVGGDGTARDICSAVGEHLPVLGIPSGVKMHSGVFAVSPEAAAEVVNAAVEGQLVDIRLQEVRDIDEAALRQGQVNSRYFGEMRVPEFGHFVQGTKNAGREVEELVLDDIAADLRERMDEGVLYLVGAGTTPKALMDDLGLDNTLLGIDLVKDERLLAQDQSARQLEQILERHDGQVVAILSVTGGQGSLIGRGNQQLSPAILRRIGRDNLWVLATKSKIKTLDGRSLLMDSNDPELDQLWSGYIEVTTGYHDRILYPLGLTDAQQGDVS